MKPKNLIRKAGALLTAGALMLGTVSQVFAAPSPPSRTDGEGYLTPWNPVYGQSVTAYTSAGTITQSEFLDLTYTDGEWGGSVFCLEPGAAVTANDAVTGGVFIDTYNALSYEQRTNIQRVMGFMTHDYNPDSSAGDDHQISAHSYYWTYQCLIWHYAGYMTDEQAQQTLTQTRTKNGSTYSVGAPPEYTRIRGLMDEYDTRPSFGVNNPAAIDASCTYELALDPNTGTYSTIIHDTSGMLANGRMNTPTSTNGSLTFTQCNMDGTANASGEYLKITATAAIPQGTPAVVSQVKKAEYNPIATQCAVFYNGTTDHQTVLGKGVMGSDPEEVHFAVYTQAGPLTISKQDATTGTELPGAELVLTDKETGAEIERWTSTTTPHAVANVTAMRAGKTYVLTETIAPANYKVTTAVEFVYTGNAGQQVVMKNELHGRIQVQKTGEMLTGTTAHDVKLPDGSVVTVNRLNFSDKGYAGIKFGVYNAETDQQVTTFTTDETGLGVSELLPCGLGEEYYIKEIETPAGLVQNPGKIAVDIALTGNTYLAEVEVDNEAAGVELVLYKEGEFIIPNTTDAFGIEQKGIEGAYFGVYTAEDFKDAAGNLVMKKDTLVALSKTDSIGECIIKEALVAGDYYVKEVYAVEGYELDETKHPFTVTYKKNSTDDVTEMVLNQDSPYLNKFHSTSVEIAKVDGAGNPLGGVEFDLYRKGTDGEYIQIGHYVTDETTGKISITNMPYGEYYFKEVKGLLGFLFDADKKYEFEVTGEEEEG